MGDGIAAQGVQALEEMQIRFAILGRQDRVSDSTSPEELTCEPISIDVCWETKQLDHSSLKDHPCLSNCGVQLTAGNERLKASTEAFGGRT